MTRRAFGWTALAVFLFGVNTGVMVWLHGREAGSGGTGSPGLRGARDLPPESSVRPRAPAEGEALDAPQEPRTLLVRVTSSRGTPLAGATVRVLPGRRGFRSPFPAPLLAEGTTDDDGSARFEGLSPAPFWRVEASAPGHAAGIATGPGPEILVPLWKAATLSGSVLEKGTGAPIVGAVVKLIRTDPREEDPPSASAETAADGTFTMEGLPRGIWRATASSRRTGAAEAEHLFLEEARTTLVRLEVPRGVDLAGRVLYTGSDKPLPGGSLHLEARQGGPAYPRWVREAPVDADGRFRLAGVPVEGTAPLCWVTTLEGTVITAPFPRIRLDPATGLPAGDLVISIPWNTPAGLRYQGRITDPSGAAVAGARVLVGDHLAGGVAAADRGGIANLRETRTDPEGRWSLPGSGHIGGEVLVLHPAFAPGFFQLPYRSRSRTFDFTLADPVALLVVARDRSGRPTPGVEVRALLRNPDPMLSRNDFGDVLEGLRPNPVTDGEGRAVVGPLGPGSWYLVARTADGTLSGRVLLEMEPGAEGVVDLPMEPVGSIEGCVVDLDGARAAGIPISIIDGYTQEESSTVTGADGAFTLPALPTFPWDPAGAGTFLNLGGTEWRPGARSLRAHPGKPVLWRVARPADAPSNLVVQVLESPGRRANDISWEIRFRGGLGGRAEGWGADVPGAGVLTVPLVRGRGAVLTVTAGDRGEGSVHLDSLAPDVGTIEVLLE